MVMVAEIIEKQEIEQPDEGVGSYTELGQIPKIKNILSLESFLLDISPEVPKEILLGSLRDGRLRVKWPIKVKFTREDKHFIAEAEELNEFGFGENPSEALYDLQRAIVELYFTLDNERERLGQDLKNIWHILQSKIVKR
jgi:hypothetical protein